MTQKVRAPVAIIAVACGCFNASPPAGGACTQAGECPAGQQCSSGVCQKTCAGDECGTCNNDAVANCPEAVISEAIDIGCLIPAVDVPAHMGTTTGHANTVNLCATLDHGFDETLLWAAPVEGWYRFTAEHTGGGSALSVRKFGNDCVTETVHCEAAGTLVADVYVVAAQSTLITLDSSWITAGAGSYTLYIEQCGAEACD